MNAPEYRTLGASGLIVPALGIGTDSWGEKMLGYGKGYSSADLYDAYRALLDGGFNFFDTAEGYARGQSESLLGRFQKQDGRPILIATKYDNPLLFPELLGRPPSPAMAQAIDRSLIRLGVETIDLYQIHFSIPRNRTEEYAEALAQAVRSGKVRAVGVSNFNAPLMRAMHESLAARKIPLAANQVMFSALSRYPETNGVLAACRELNIALIAYVPLELGLLTGKYRDGRKKLGRYQKMFFRLGELDLFHEHGPERKPLIQRLTAKPRALLMAGAVLAEMEAVGKRHGKTIAQIAINWLLAADPLVIPIPGAKNARQAQDNIGAAGWRMSKEEYERIGGAK
jgi:aryl-alcohol dehydrogenase-like predicted oxidoreductase